MKAEITAPKNIKIAVMLKVQEAEKKLARRNFVVYLLSSLLSIGGLVYVFLFVHQSFVQSGFYEYASLFFSGDVSVVVYWKELTLSLAESIPVISVMLFLSILLVFIWSGIRVIREADRSFGFTKKLIA